MTTATPESAVQQQGEGGEDQYESDHFANQEPEDDEYAIDGYEIVATPNDFNTRTLVDFINSGVVIIPGFQRNYVWDIKRASRLIESMIVGLPIPQVFLYEQDRNKFLVIDGQQRLMSIYYFVKGRFPRKEKRAELRITTGGASNVDPELLADDEYFTDFKLSLPHDIPGKTNRFHKTSYSDLDSAERTQFDLRTIRHIVVLQIKPDGDDAMYEIFNRLNSGGVTLTPQEVRRCAYDSEFYEMLYRTNGRREWRMLVGAKVPDIHMRDVEILLRGFAMLINGEQYRPSMVKFLNQFSKDAKSFDAAKLLQLEQLLESFLQSCTDLEEHAFHNINGRFSPMIFESVFVAACTDAHAERKPIRGKITPESLDALKRDADFRTATQQATTASSSVAIRLERARATLELA